MEFRAPDVAAEARPLPFHGSSIPLSKAMGEEVLLAWQMSGQPLPRAHGAPVRVVVPRLHRGPQRQMGHHHHRATRPVENYFQALDYRMLAPEADPDTVPEGEGISL